MLNSRLPILTLLFIGSFFSTNAQDFTKHEELKKGCLYFPVHSHDFGTFKESDGIQEVRFVAYNVYKYPVVLRKADGGCGCTSIRQTRDTVTYGDSVEFFVTYDPKNRPGEFDRHINIFNDGIPYLVGLQIKGNVEPRVRTTADNYPMNYGNFMMTNSYFDFGFMYREDVDTFTIGVYNRGKEPITVEGISGRPAHIILNSKNLTLQPGEESELTMIFDARLTTEYGDMIHYLTLKTNDPQVPEIMINVNAHIMERFPEQTKRRIRKNPKIRFDQTEIDAGKVLVGDTVTAVYVIHNDGKRPLIIRRIQPTCGCTMVNAEKMEIGPGESTKVTIAFNTAGRDGEDTKSITIITNDPTRAISKVFLKTLIVQNPNAL